MQHLGFMRISRFGPLLALAFMFTTPSLAKNYEAVETASRIKFKAYSTFDNPTGMFNTWKIKVSESASKKSIGSVELEIDVASLGSVEVLRSNGMKTA